MNSEPQWLICPVCQGGNWPNAQLCRWCDASLAQSIPTQSVTAQTQNRPSSTGRKILLYGGAALLTIFAGLFLIGSQVPDNPRPYSVVYHVDGTVSAADVTYQNSEGEIKLEKNVALPWNKMFSAHKGDALHVSAQGKGQSGDIATTIQVDNYYAKTSISRGSRTTTSADTTCGEEPLDPVTPSRPIRWPISTHPNARSQDEKAKRLLAESRRKTTEESAKEKEQLYLQRTTSKKTTSATKKIFGLTENERRALFSQSVQCEDMANREADVAHPDDYSGNASSEEQRATLESRIALADKLTKGYKNDLAIANGLTLGQLEQIEKEAFMKEWPLPN